MTFRAAWLIAVLTSLLGVFLVLTRPWFARWGATAAEASRALPGDDLVAGRDVEQETRAVTIAAPAAQVWPWLAQLGQDRGGFYSYELLEDVAGCEMPAVDHLDPALQRWRLGDQLWMYPPAKAGGAGHAVLAVLEPGHAMAFRTRQFGTPLSAEPDGSWAFVVEPIDARTSRLIVRGRAERPRNAILLAVDHLVFEPAHFAMERRMMLTLGARAEGRPVSRRTDDAQVALWTIAFAAMAWSAVAFVRGARPALAAFTVYGIAFELLTMAQPSPWLGAALLIAVTAATRMLGLRR